ncbi:MAG TPA: hypothetical protein DEP91_08545 [Sphingomonas bacterium]|jgi:hypothetical protein|uniref:Uncharacterized protein n=1 Tax=Sphingomonas bacterium TaxID=1895847 RepID=A0A3D0WCE4_9SPHN|nr:hypothetical protein [Sphingomonas bacterium]
MRRMIHALLLAALSIGSIADAQIRVGAPPGFRARFQLASIAPVLPTEIPFTVNMAAPKLWYSATDPTSFRAVDGTQATAGAPVETIRDLSGNARDALSAGTGNAASSATTRGVVAPAETLGTLSVSPLRVNNGRLTDRYNAPAGSLTAPSGSAGDIIVTFQRVRVGTTAAIRSALGSSTSNFLSVLGFNDSSALGRTFVHGIAAGSGVSLKTDTADRLELVTIEKVGTQGATFGGRINGVEPAIAGAGSGINANLRMSVGNAYGANQGANLDIFDVVVLPAGTSRANVQRVEGAIAWAYGVQTLLPADHPYRLAAPTVPSGIASTASFVDANWSTVTAQQTWLGPQVEIQADSFDSSLTTTAIENQPAQWGFPASLTSAEQARLKNEWFPGDGRGYMFLRFPLGFAYRGFRNVDGPTGLARNIGERWAGQNSSLANMLANVASAGGGLFPEYWSLAPYWKTNSSFSGGRGSTTNGVDPAQIWAGGSYARSVTLESIRTTDPTQYAAQLAALSSAIVDDLEYLHLNVAPVRGFALANEPRNQTSAGYGHTYYASAQQYVDVLEAVVPKIRASSVLSTWGGQANQVRINAWSYQPIPAELLADPVYAEIDHTTLHYIPDHGADADYARTNMASWMTQSGGKAVANNEFEYFSLAAPNDDPARRFANTALVQAHFLTLGRAPTHNPMIHLFKQMGQTGTDGNTEGYAVNAVRLPAPFGQAPSTPGDPYPGVGHGEYIGQSYNVNAVRTFSDNLLVGARVQPLLYASMPAGVQVTPFVNPGDKRGFVVVNRNTAPLSITIGVGRAAAMRCRLYTANDNGAGETIIIASALAISVPANGARACVQQ